jgi:cobalt-zinc-cadmium efflux system outer membrane protein
LTLEQALALARERGPRILSAGARIEEARGRLAGASTLLRENPVLEAGAGRRYSDDGDTLEAAVGLHQTFELGGQRRARIAGAEAGFERAGAARDDSLRRLLQEVAVAFYGTLHADESLRLATSAEGLAAEVARIAERRHRAEDVVLDVNAGCAFARAFERQVTEATLASIPAAPYPAGDGRGGALVVEATCAPAPLPPLSSSRGTGP